MIVPHIAYEHGVLSILDQTKLPGSVEFLELREWSEVPAAIAAMTASEKSSGYGEVKRTRSIPSTAATARKSSAKATPS